MKRCVCVSLLLALGVMALAAHAEVVSVNFSGGQSSEPNGYPLAPTDQAGNPTVPGSFTVNWNNAPGASGSNQPLANALGAPTPIRLSYSTDLGGWSLPDNSAGANLSGGQNPQMMRGYLDAADNGQVTLTGLAAHFASYQIALFFDGDNGGSWRVARYTVVDNATSLQLFQGSGEDSEGVNFNAGGGDSGNENPDGLFQVPLAGGAGNQMWPVSPNNGEGNFLLTDLLTADSITIQMAGTAGDIHRAPLNGIQLIGTPVPEPLSVSLLGLGFCAAWARRRRRA